MHKTIVIDEHDQLPHVKGCTPDGRRAASMAERRGDGGPPDGHDPEALRATPRLAKVHVGAVVLILIVVPIRFSNRHAMFWIPNIYYAKES